MVFRFISRVLGCGGGSRSMVRRRRPGKRLLAAAGQAIEAMEGRAMLAVMYVDANATGPSSGTSWGAAYRDLQLALAAAKSGDQIRIADGTYKPTSTTNRAISFALRNGVAIYGGYAGHGAPNPNARDIAFYRTILSGDIGTAGTRTDNSYQVLTATGLGASTVLDGITVTGGYDDRAGIGLGRGGGLHASGSALTIINCVFSGNFASSGGGMYTSTSSLTLTNCMFVGNSADSGGGARCLDSYAPTMINCTFSGNTARAGGGIYGVFSLTNCILWGNNAADGPQARRDDFPPVITLPTATSRAAGRARGTSTPIPCSSARPGQEQMALSAPPMTT